jgi:trans-aconitate methyltransferase
MTTWNPDEYARNSAAQKGWAEELLSGLNLEGEEAILDLGCGDGKITAALAEAVPQGRVVGIDNSEEMIRYAQAQHPFLEHPNLQFRLLDVRALDYTDEFNLIFSNAALHWVKDHRAILSGAYRALRKDGRLALSFGGKGNAAAVLEVVSAVGLRPEWRENFQAFKNPYDFYGPDEYRPWLVDAGFLIQRLELLLKDMVHAGPDRLASWIRTTGMPITSRVPESRKEALIRDLVSAYLERFPADPDGNVHVSMVRLEVEAKKP